MDKKALKQFIKLYKFRIILVAIGVVFICLVIYILILGVNSYMTLESFYKKIAKASPPGELYWKQSRELYFAGKTAMIVWSPFILDELAGRRLTFGRLRELRRDPVPAFAGRRA